MSQIGLHFHRPAGREMAKLDEFVTPRRFEEDQFGAARRLVPSGLFQTEHVAVEPHRAFEVIDSITGVQQSECLAHRLTITRNGCKAMVIKALAALRSLG